MTSHGTQCWHLAEGWMRDADILFLPGEKKIPLRSGERRFPTLLAVEAWTQFTYHWVGKGKSGKEGVGLLQVS